MKKVLVIMILMCLIAATGTAYNENQASVSIDGDLIAFDQSSGYPFIDANNRTQVPFRQTLEAIGARVDWEADTGTAIAEAKGIIIRVPIGESHIYRNGERVENDTDSLIKDGRTYLPIRIVLEAFGYSVKWDSNACMVLVRQAVDETWSSPAEAGNVSMLNGLIGLVFSGPDAELEEWEFFSFDRPHIMIYNLSHFLGSPEEVIMEPIEFEYRLFRVSDCGDELLYNKPFPAFSGNLPAETFVTCAIDIPYWTWENLIPGSYKIQLVFPYNFVFRFAGDDTVRYLPVKPNMYNESYEFIIK